MTTDAQQFRRTPSYLLVEDRLQGHAPKQAMETVKNAERVMNKFQQFMNCRTGARVPTDEARTFSRRRPSPGKVFMRALEGPPSREGYRVRKERQCDTSRAVNPRADQVI